jgi:hypothetical protein
MLALSARVRFSSEADIGLRRRRARLARGDKQVHNGARCGPASKPFTGRGSADRVTPIGRRGGRRGGRPRLPLVLAFTMRRASVRTPLALPGRSGAAGALGPEVFSFVWLDVGRSGRLAVWPGRSRTGSRTGSPRSGRPGRSGRSGRSAVGLVGQVDRWWTGSCGQGRADRVVRTGSSPAGQVDRQAGRAYPPGLVRPIPLTWIWTAPCAGRSW